MAWTRPTLTTLRTQMRERLEAAMTEAGFDADALVPRTVIKVGGEVFAGGLHLVYGAIAWVADQILPDRAQGAYLLRHAGIYQYKQLAAQKWQGTMTFTGVDETAIGVDAPVVRSDGAVYLVTEAGEVDGANVTLEVEAEVGGADYNLEDGQTLTLGAPIAGIDSAVTVESTTQSGTDLETITELQQRLLTRIAEQPQGGALLDYERWAREAGATRAMAVSCPRGAGSVDLYFLVAEGTGVDGTIIPTPEQVEAMQAYIEPRKPADFEDFLAKAPTTTEVDYTVTAVSGATQEQVEAQWNAMFAARALATQNEGEPATIRVSDHWAAALLVADSIVITSPAADLVPDVGEVFVLGDVTWP